MRRGLAVGLVFLVIAAPPIAAKATEPASLFSSFRSICLESGFNRPEMETKARALGFFSTEGTSITTQVAGAKFLRMGTFVMGPAFPPERILLLGEGIDYGDAGLFPEASACTVMSLKADASAISDALTWVGEARPMQSVQGWSVFVLEAEQGSLRSLGANETAGIEAATASGRLVILMVGGDVKTTSLTATRLKKAEPLS